MVSLSQCSLYSPFLLGQRFSAPDSYSFDYLRLRLLLFAIRWALPAHFYLVEQLVILHPFSTTLSWSCGPPRDRATHDAHFYLFMVVRSSGPTALREHICQIYATLYFMFSSQKSCRRWGLWRARRSPLRGFPRSRFLASCRG